MEKNYIITAEQYLALKQAWKHLSDIGGILPGDVVIYNLLRGKPVRNGFAPVKILSKIKSGDAWYAFNNACHDAERALPVRSYSIDERHASRLTDAFKARYGIDAVAGLFDALQAARHE